MDAVQFVDHGDSDVVEYGSYPTPSPGPAEVVVDVCAGALNHLDVWTRRGLPGLDLELPHVPGSDAAGVVDSVGDAVDRFEPGDRVAVTAGIGCGTCEFCRDGDPTLCVDYEILGEHCEGVHAERVAVPAAALVPVPEGVDWITAAAATWRQSLRSLARGGRLLTCGATTGPTPETNVNRIFGNQLSILGSTMATPGELDDVLELVWDGTFEVLIREVLPMSETARGHELLENREGFGKVVVPDSEYEGESDE